MMTKHFSTRKYILSLMGEVVNVVVAFAVIVFIIRWATRGGGGNDESRRSRNLLGFHPKHVSTDMVSIVHSMFPHIPRDNIHYDLLKTGSVEVTSNKLLERGFLDAPPPPYFQLFPTQSSPVTTSPSSPVQTPAAVDSSSKVTSKSTLISRFELEDRLRSEAETSAAIDAGGKATWEDTADRREASLRERKAQMVLAARRRLLEQQQKEAGTSS